ncbi:MAG: hypothetical protein ACLS89_00810 [Collinsella sp.]
MSAIERPCHLAVAQAIMQPSRRQSQRAYDWAYPEQVTRRVHAGMAMRGWATSYPIFSFFLTPARQLQILPAGSDSAGNRLSMRYCELMTGRGSEKMTSARDAVQEYIR